MDPEETETGAIVRTWFIGVLWYFYPPIEARQLSAPCNRYAGQGHDIQPNQAVLHLTAYPIGAFSVGVSCDSIFDFN